MPFSTLPPNLIGVNLYCVKVRSESNRPKIVAFLFGLFGPLSPLPIGPRSSPKYFSVASRHLTSV
jgi:hypothetical protein